MGCAAALSAARRTEERPLTAVAPADAKAKSGKRRPEDYGRAAAKSGAKRAAGAAPRRPEARRKTRGGGEAVDNTAPRNRKGVARKKVNAAKKSREKSAERKAQGSRAHCSPLKAKIADWGPEEHPARGAAGEAGAEREQESPSAVGPKEQGKAKAAAESAKGPKAVPESPAPVMVGLTPCGKDPTLNPATIAKVELWLASAVRFADPETLQDPQLEMSRSKEKSRSDRRAPQPRAKAVSPTGQSAAVLCLPDVSCGAGGQHAPSTGEDSGASELRRLSVPNLRRFFGGSTDGVAEEVSSCQKAVPSSGLDCSGQTPSGSPDAPAGEPSAGV